MELISDFPGLTRQPALLFVALAAGRMRSYGFIENFMDTALNRPDVACDLPSVAKRLRKIIRPHGFSVESVATLGFVLRAPAGWVPPWIRSDSAQQQQSGG